MSHSGSEHDLLQAYLDGELPEEQLAPLEARLLAEPALADALVRLAREEAILREWAQSSVAADAIDHDPIARRPRSRPSRRIALLAALAASIALFAIIVSQRDRFGTTPSRPVVATLEEIEGDVQIVSADGDMETARSGQSLFAGQEVLTGEDDSSTVLRINDSRLTLASETRIKLGRDGARADWTPTLFVSEGIVNAEVFRNPLVLRNAFAELRGKDGKFSFVSLPESTFIETDTGSALLTRSSDGRSIDVNRGQFAVVRANEPLQSQTSTPRMMTPRRSLPAGSGPVHGLSFDPSGASLLTATADMVRRWDLASLKPLATPYSQKERSVRVFSPSADGLRFALHSDERQARLVDAGTAADIWTKKGARRVTALALSPDGRTVAAAWSGRDGNEVRLHDTTLGIDRTLHAGHVGAITALAWSPRGDLLATAGPDRSVRIWNVADLQPVRSILKLPQDTRCLQFSPDGKLLAIGDRKGNIRLLEVASGSERHVLTGHLRDVMALAFSPDGVTLASTSTDGFTRIWHVARGQELASFKGHASGVLSVAFAPDGKSFATGGQDRKVHFWNMPALP